MVVVERIRDHQGACKSIHASFLLYSASNRFNVAHVHDLVVSQMTFVPKWKIAFCVGLIGNLTDKDSLITLSSSTHSALRHSAPEGIRVQESGTFGPSHWSANHRQEPNYVGQHNLLARLAYYAAHLPNTHVSLVCIQGRHTKLPGSNSTVWPPG